MLTSGMVPALYADDEKEQIIGQVISSFKLMHDYDAAITSQTST